MAEHNDLGKWGEDEAALYLEDQGYVIIDRDWKIGRRDLDIIAASPDGRIHFLHSYHLCFHFHIIIYIWLLPVELGLKYQHRIEGVLQMLDALHLTAASHDGDDIKAQHFVHLVFLDISIVKNFDG